jgi:hypothetical protein
MMERSAFLESVEHWCKADIATSNDRLLGALVTLRLHTADLFAFIPSQPQSDVTSSPQRNIEPLLACVGKRIDRWEEQWLRAVQTATADTEESCHPFLIRFYGMHSRLHLSTLPLQNIFSRSEQHSLSDMDMLWAAYWKAVDMLRLISEYTTKVYFAQDSLHVMTAYSAALLVKVI